MTFCRGVKTPVLWTLLSLVGLVVPGQPGSDLFEPGINLPHTDDANEPLVAVLLPPLHVHLFAGEQGIQGRLGAAGERLTPLGGVYSGNADAMLGKGRIQQCKAVTVSQAHNPTS